QLQQPSGDPDQAVFSRGFFPRRLYIRSWPRHWFAEWFWNAAAEQLQTEVGVRQRRLRHPAPLHSHGQLRHPRHQRLRPDPQRLEEQFYWEPLERAAVDGVRRRE